MLVLSSATAAIKTDLVNAITKDVSQAPFKFKEQPTAVCVLMDVFVAVLPIQVLVLIVDLKDILIPILSARDVHLDVKVAPIQLPVPVAKSTIS